MQQVSAKRETSVAVMEKELHFVAVPSLPLSSSWEEGLSCDIHEKDKKY
jgi:hypothetical protein